MLTTRTGKQGKLGNIGEHFPGIILIRLENRGKLPKIAEKSGILILEIWKKKYGEGHGN